MYGAPRERPCDRCSHAGKDHPLEIDGWKTCRFFDSCRCINYLWLNSKGEAIG